MLLVNVISFFYSAPFICFFNYIVQVKKMFKRKNQMHFGFLTPSFISGLLKTSPSSSPINCATTDGFRCTFPFIFENVTWTTCTTADETSEFPKAWCNTQLEDSSGWGWGYCHESCLIDQGLRIQSFYDAWQYPIHYSIHFSVFSSVVRLLATTGPLW